MRTVLARYLWGVVTPVPLSRSRAEWPLSNRAIASFSVFLIVIITAVDVLTPAGLVVGTLLSAPVALSGLGASRRLSWTMVGLALTGNLLAGLINGLRDGSSPSTLANRAVSMLAALLVGILTVRSQAASLRSAQLAEEERRLTRERSLRALIEAVSGPFGQAEFVSRSAQALQVLSGATSVEIGAVEKGVLRAPHARWPSEHQGGGLLDQRLPLDYLARPSTSGAVWANSGGDLFLARLTRPDGDDLLVFFDHPLSAPDVLTEALQILQPLLERTALLDDLAAQKSLLLQQGEVMRDLIYAFSHDLRTPLMANALNMQSALRGAYGPLPAQYLQTLEHGLEANETLLSLADQLLLLAKYEGGEAEELLSLDLRALTLSVLSQLEDRARSKRLTFDSDLQPVRVLGSRHDLRRAVQNLLDNAVKFSPPGGTVSLRLQAEDGEAVLTVADEGLGVPPMREASLFQRFRGSGAGAGSGLGLYLTRRIMEAHGGQVRYVRTAPPLTPTARSLFSLTLPLENA